jgi:hypothetical protein
MRRMLKKTKERNLPRKKKNAKQKMTTQED